MEDYDTFVQHHLSSLKRREEEHNKPTPSSSLICFYGRPILPPLLSGGQREEMQGLRDRAQKAAVHRKLKEDSRMAFVQTILHSVQLRKTPTLEELLKETQINPEHHNSPRRSLTNGSSFRGTKDDPLLSPAPNRPAEDGVSPPPFSSTTYSAFLASNVTPQQEDCLLDPHPSQHGSQPSPFNGVSHQSSGYETYNNVENTLSVSGGLDAGLNFVSSKGAHSFGAFFLHNTSNTVAKMPDIISYPPIDGEELERSGMESSFYDDFVDVKDVCCSELQEDSAVCDSLRGENSESSHDSSTEGEANLSVTTVLDPDKYETSDRTVGHISLSDNTDFSDNPESSQTVNVLHCSTPELHIQQDLTEAEQTDDHEDEDMPYRLSLQALLKKSQEYRRRQRMLRNQAKNSKIQERTQEQPRVRAEEPSLSDKENDEFLHKGSLTAEGKTTKEMRGTFIPSVQTSPKKSWDSERMIESELFGENFKIKNTSLTGEENTKQMTGDDGEITLRNNKLNISQEVMTQQKMISAFTQEHPKSTEAEILLKTSPKDVHKGEGKYQTIPALSFCRSPVRCKSKNSIHNEDAVDGTGSSEGVTNPGLEKEISPRAVSSKVTPVDERDLRGVSVKSSQHIDQLETNLSGLKILISDLESTLTENFRNQSQTESRLMQSDDEERSNDVDVDQREPLGRRSSDNVKSTFEDSGSARSIRDKDEFPVTEQENRTGEVNLRELRLVKTLVTERGKEKSCCNDGLSKSHGHGGLRKQQPAAKCLLSAAQRQRIPDMFRRTASEAAAPPNTSVLSDTSNHPVDKRTEAAEESHNSTRSPSLNQSYDVDAPSGLWLLEGSGPDSGLRGGLVQEKQLTPEGEGEAGVSRVKRRLLMHMSEETPQRNAGSVVRPNSSTPRAAEGWNEGQGSLKERQEQLQQAHAAQVRALQDEHRRQQEELLQPCSTLSEHCRPLLSAAVKGFLTRRLLKTERVAQLVRTVRDTRQLLQALQQQSAGTGEFSSRQDLLLQERVTLQLRAARYEVNDIFFSLSAGERMQLISWDRELARERELRDRAGTQAIPEEGVRCRTATQKSLERKRGVMMQKKAAGRLHGAVTGTGHSAGSSPEQPLETKRGQFRANPQRVPKSTNSSRPR
ncbi:uncharacterized protein si:ch73-100l22.3 isoform X2 [Notolabrus celidotus]|uniref:uncharacterized protein si:ch73-100l22.3 isoform X2 n=1 Tax=Notolabrus celidotus TaxID=1203425 RepID=UPI00148F9AD4|nr:uncharacterized protein si:ch73-100l22.3 isoform X2 [Notolabrus celidotus]